MGRFTGTRHPLDRSETPLAVASTVTDANRWSATMTAYDLPPRQTAAQRVGAGLAASIGALSGLLGPVLLGLLVWGAFAATSDNDGAMLFAVLVVIAVVALPVALLVVGLGLAASDEFVAWGTGALVASATWLVSTAAVCVLFLIGGLAALMTRG